MNFTQVAPISLQIPDSYTNLTSEKRRDTSESDSQKSLQSSERSLHESTLQWILFSLV